MGFNKTCHKSLCLLCCLAFIWWNETHFELFFVVHVSLKSIRCWKGKFSTFTYYLITVYSDWLGFVTLLRKFISFKKSFKFGKVSWNISVTSIFLGLRLNRINLLFGENCTKNWKKKKKLKTYLHDDAISSSDTGIRVRISLFMLEKALAIQFFHDSVEHVSDSLDRSCLVSPDATTKSQKQARKTKKRKRTI